MRTRSTLSILTVTAAMFIAPAAIAGDMSSKAKTSTKVVTTPAQPQKKVQTQAVVAAEVRGAVARGDLIAVEGPNGTVFYNKLIRVADLPDPTLTVQAVDTVTFTHEGRTYTNRIVD